MLFLRLSEKGFFLGMFPSFISNYMLHVAKNIYVENLTSVLNSKVLFIKKSFIKIIMVYWGHK